MARVPIVYILIGLPGAGKSTWARKKVMEKRSRPIVVINRDSLREMINGGRYEYTKEKESIVKDMSFNCIRAAWECKYREDMPDLIIDETHTTIERRRMTIIPIEILSNHVQPKIVYVYFTEKNTSLLLGRRMQNNRGYDSYQWANVIREMARNFESPSIHETKKMGGIYPGTIISEIKKINTE